MPADWTPLDDDPDTGDPLATALLRLEAQILEVRTCAVGDDFPADPVEGMLFLHNGGDQPKFYLYTAIDGGALGWEPVAPLSRLPASINADPSDIDDRQEPFQHLGLRVENAAALPAAAATNKGLLIFRTGDGRLWMSNGAAWAGLMEIAEAGSYDTVELPLEGEVGNDAATPPTLVSKGVFRGYLFDDVGEKRVFVFRVPQNWKAGTAMRARLWQLLDAAETAGDDIEWEGNFRSLVPGTSKAGQAATALADSSTDIGADATGIDDGGLHYNDFVIPHDAAGNLLAAGNIVALQLNRKTVGGAGKVAGTIAIRMELHFFQNSRHERA